MLAITGKKEKKIESGRKKIRELRECLHVVIKHVRTFINLPITSQLSSSA
jgi:hypothetical protein